jgi:hypothetical protein
MARPRSIIQRAAARLESPEKVWTATRAFIWACVLPLLKQIMPVSALVRLAWRRPRVTSRDTASEAQAIAAARWASRLVRRKSGGNCLERALIAYRLLSEANAAPTIVIGVGRDAGGTLRGHAWVLLDGMPAGEADESLSTYTPIVAFGPEALRLDRVPDGLV